ncbi:MAG: hypothetical protein Q8P76_01930 [bacterium]|nr:hypothetical protein [bacterium]
MLTFLGMLACFGLAGYLYFRVIRTGSNWSAFLLLAVMLLGIWLFSMVWIDGWANALHNPAIGTSPQERLYLGIGFFLIFLLGCSMWLYLQPHQTREQEARNGTFLCISMGICIGALIGAGTNSLPVGVVVCMGTAAVSAFILKNY